MTTKSRLTTTCGSWFVTCAALVLLVSAFVGPISSTAANAAAPVPVATGTVLTALTLGVGTQLDAIDMLSSNVGFGVASSANLYARNYFTLVKTTDGGSTWRVRYALPFKPFTGYGPTYFPGVDFSSQNIGYVNNAGGPWFMTTTGGATWSALSPTPHNANGYGASVVSSSLTIENGRVTQLSVRCPKSGVGDLVPVCHARLTQYRVGSKRMVRTTSVPNTGTKRNVTGSVLVMPSPTTDVVLASFGGGPVASSPSIEVTENFGKTWSERANPCGTLPVGQLLAPTASHWLLYCLQGVGMMHSDVELWSSNDAGGSWTLLDETAPDLGHQVGNMPGVASVLYASRSGRTLYAALGGASGGVEVSTNGGSTWRYVSSLKLNDLGGAPEEMSTFGSSGVVLLAQGGYLYWSDNGDTWRQAPWLPSGTPSGVATCPSSGALYTTVQRSHGNKSQLSWLLGFSNEGLRPCELSALSSAQTVSGPHGHAVGPAAIIITLAGHGRSVLLAPGGHAAVKLIVGNSDDWSTRMCQERDIGGVYVRFVGNPSNFYFDTSNAIGGVCSKVASVLISQQF